MNDGDLGTPFTSRPVSRDVNLQLVFLGLDSLYLVLEYPSSDIFDFFFRLVRSADVRSLVEGIPYYDFVIRRGGLGYKLSVWDGDARLFLTDQVEDKLFGTVRAGQGMGMMLQLGPVWLRRYGDICGSKMFRDNVLAQFVSFGVVDPAAYPCRVNRMDVTADLRGLDVAGLDVEAWRAGWVGHAGLSGVYFAGRSRAVQGLAVGSSRGAVRFKVYDKVTEAQRAGKLSFWRAVWGLADGDFSPVGRLEWSVKAYQGRFEGLRYLPEVTFERFLGLLNYLVDRWGRLCIPQPADTNRSRWPLAPLWADLRRLVDGWSFEYEGQVARDYHYLVEVNPVYLNVLAGWLAGLQVRVALEEGGPGPVSLAQGLEYLHQQGFDRAEIQRRAVRRFAVAARLR